VLQALGSEAYVQHITSRHPLVADLHNPWWAHRSGRAGCKAGAL